MNQEAKRQFDDIIEQMALVYKHDSRPWMIGYSARDSIISKVNWQSNVESFPPL